MKLLYLVLVSTLSLSAFANGSDWKKQEKPKTTEQQKMEEAPISGSIGGAQSGEEYEQGDQKEQMQHDAEKQKFLYEYGDYYRRGL